MPQMPNQFFTQSSLATFAGATAATYAVTTALRAAFAVDAALTGFVVAQLICLSTAVLALPKPLAIRSAASTVLIALVNGCLVFMTATGTSYAAEEAARGAAAPDQQTVRAPASVPVEAPLPLPAVEEQVEIVARRIDGLQAAAERTRALCIGTPEECGERPRPPDDVLLDFAVEADALADSLAAISKRGGRSQDGAPPQLPTGASASPEAPQRANAFTGWFRP